jgi:hypothetical protein
VGGGDFAGAVVKIPFWLVLLLGLTVPVALIALVAVWYHWSMRGF